jgi:DNA mismatch repair protein MutL
MPEIKQLPPSVVNKIAAGEVIERPASVVKEIVENAVDSGATRVDVSIEQGGAQLIRVADNGCGIAADQLTLAVASHATSKIRDADDLFSVHTFGFRGEALASIAEVSQMHIRSRPATKQAGSELEINGGRRSEVSPCGCPPGTIIEIRNLFFNTPVRRKFMKTTQTELGHASEAFTRIVLAHPQVHFTLRHNDRILHDLPPVDSWRDRIAAFFGPELNDHLIWVESDQDGVRIVGYVADPEMSRSNNRLQYLLLNGRFIRDRPLQHALGEAYRGLLLTGRFPIAFIRIDLPSDTVDVNVHPTKIEVRFQDAGRLYSQLLATLRNKFLSTDLTAKVQPVGVTSLARESSLDPKSAAQHRREVSDWARGTSAQSAGDATAAAMDRQSSLGLNYALNGRAPDFVPFDKAPGQSGSDLQSVGPGQHSGRVEAGSDDSATSADDRQQNAAYQLDRQIQAETGASPIGLQLHQRYLVTENEEGMVVVDQHALHERILYEQIRNKVLSGKMETQRLLVPEPVSLTAAEAAAALEARETLAKMGIEIEAFGGDTVLVSAYPAMLANMSPNDILRQVVDLLLEEGKTPERRDILDELLHMISCKAAIKAGDHLSSGEVTALLEQRHHFQDSHHCPHGRPTALVFTREELDKRFRRT